MFHRAAKVEKRKEKKKKKKEKESEKEEEEDEDKVLECIFLFFIIEYILKRYLKLSH